MDIYNVERISRIERDSEPFAAVRVAGTLDAR